MPEIQPSVNTVPAADSSSKAVEYSYNGNHFVKAKSMLLEISVGLHMSVSKVKLSVIALNEKCFVYTTHALLESL
jgi:hypothetical protein